MNRFWIAGLFIMVAAVITGVASWYGFNSWSNRRLVRNYGHEYVRMLREHSKASRKV